MNHEGDYLQTIHIDYISNTWDPLQNLQYILHFWQCSWWNHRDNHPINYEPQTYIGSRIAASFEMKGHNHEEESPLAISITFSNYGRERFSLFRPSIIVRSSWNSHQMSLRNTSWDCLDSGNAAPTRKLRRSSRSRTSFLCALALVEFSWCYKWASGGWDEYIASGKLT